MHYAIFAEQYTKPRLLIVPGSVTNQWEDTAKQPGMEGGLFWTSQLKDKNDSPTSTQQKIRGV